MLKYRHSNFHSDLPLFYKNLDPRCNLNSRLEDAYSQGVTLFPVFEVWEYDRHLHGGKFHVAPDIISSGDCEPMIPHFLSNPCFVEPDDGPNIVGLEDSPCLNAYFLNLGETWKEYQLAAGRESDAIMPFFQAVNKLAPVTNGKPRC